MKTPLIEDYAMIGDGRTAALISREGSLDWLCVPSFDSPACFAKILGREEHGYWSLRPEQEFTVERRYIEGTMILETIFRTSTGSVKLTDWMSIRAINPQVLRTLEGLEGEVSMVMDWVVRFDYGSILPWINRIEKDHVQAIAGPDALDLFTSFPTYDHDKKTSAQFVIKKGESQRSAMIRRRSVEVAEARPVDIETSFEFCINWWKEWISHCTYEGEFQVEVRRSLLALKSLIYRPTGGIVAAPTTSLPETIGGSRNWDYRYCWVRDSTYVLYSLLSTGFKEEAEAWREWLIRAVAGTPSQVNIMYGIRGERRLTETVLDWLPGYENSKPVRVGNAAYKQCQLDIFGELMDTLYLGRRSGLARSDTAWELQKEVVKFLETEWTNPDEGIWEVRGPKQHFVHSKVMAWVAVDRAIRSVEHFNYEGPVERWRELRETIHKDILEKGFNKELNSFTQTYGSNNVDASLLMLVIVGFLPPEDPRLIGTVKAVEEQLMDDGLLLRYRVEDTDDGLRGEEGAFLACSFWLVDAYVIMGERKKGDALFRRLISLTNDLGLLAEEYDTKKKRQVGNFPQALSHIGLINSALTLYSTKEGPAEERLHAIIDDDQHSG